MSLPNWCFPSPCLVPLTMIASVSELWWMQSSVSWIRSFWTMVVCLFCCCWFRPSVFFFSGGYIYSLASILSLSGWLRWWLCLPFCSPTIQFMSAETKKKQQQVFSSFPLLQNPHRHRCCRITTWMNNIHWVQFKLVAGPLPVLWSFWWRTTECVCVCLWEREYFFLVLLIGVEGGVSRF